MGLACCAIMKQNIVLSLLAGASANYVKFDGHQVFRISDKALDIQKLTQFNEQIDIWRYKRGAVDVRVEAQNVRGFKQWLGQEGIDAEVYIENVQDLIESETVRDRRVSQSIGDINDFNYTTYHTYQEIHEWTHEICRLH